MKNVETHIERDSLVTISRVGYGTLPTYTMGDKNIGRNVVEINVSELERLLSTGDLLVCVLEGRCLPEFDYHLKKLSSCKWDITLVKLDEGEVVIGREYSVYMDNQVILFVYPDSEGDMVLDHICPDNI